MTSPNTIIADMQAEIYALRKENEALIDAIDEARDIASIALRKAWQLGQTYWQQADSEYISQNKKSDETYAKFQQLSEDTRNAISRQKGGA